MERETLIYNGMKFHRYPESKRRHLRVYYWAHPVSKDAPIPLHREIWRIERGPIPNGCVIHHKDGNSLNNNIANLECKSRAKHQSEHGKKNADKARIVLDKFARPKAALWHKSKEGHEFHKRIGKLAWKNFKPVEKRCVECGEKYLDKSIQCKGKYCSDLCGSRYRRKNI